MTSGLIYILRSLMDLYLIIFALRLGMQWVRADFRNPIVRFVLTVTNPLVAPIRRFVAPFGKLDIATTIVYLVLLWVFSSAVLNLACQSPPDVLSTLAIAALRGLRQLLSIYLFMVFGYVMLSWVTMGGQTNPSLAALATLLGQMVHPVLAPLRRIIPPIGGLDLSPIALLLIIGAIQETLYSFAVGFGTISCPANIVV